MHVNKQILLNTRFSPDWYSNGYVIGLPLKKPCHAPPMHWPMHSPACPSTKTQIRPHQTCRHSDCYYTSLYFTSVGLKIENSSWGKRSKLFNEIETWQNCVWTNTSINSEDYNLMTSHTHDVTKYRNSVSAFILAIDLMN